MAYEPTIGLEIHAELSTRTKMFCSCANDPDETKPNTNVCPVCLAHPGTLPVINKRAVEHLLRIGTAIGGTLANFSEFDRKSYFYPDIPKGYQVSQYAYPLVQGGTLAGVAITRVHLEEDTARSIHSSKGSAIDFNRAGIPLMELVTEPVIRDAETAGRFARELQLLLRTVGAGAANLEKGEMRIEANVSVSNTGALGTKVEVKNINSFRSVERAIAFETERQATLLRHGGKVAQETRGWDESKQVTFHQRFKEGSADYRYFPEPDLPKLTLADIESFSGEALRGSLPELPDERRLRYKEAYDLKTDDITYLCATPERSTFFDHVATCLDHAPELVALAANYTVSDLAGLYAKNSVEEYQKLDPQSFASLVRLVRSGKLSSRGAKDTLGILVQKGGDPEIIAREEGLIQVHDASLLEQAVRYVLAEEEKAVAEYRSGKESALQYLIGKSMRATRGAGNPALLKDILQRLLG
jgi:aspartyl-tRNA(Asn)/glutamyl-tRNA(Gln) amidotransferase subunit B